MLVARAEFGNELVASGNVALADVEQHEDRLLGQETKSADALLLVVAQLNVADRLALAQRRSELF